MLAGRKDLIEVDGHAERDEEEAADARTDPVGRLERGRVDELRPERQAAVGEEDGISFFCSERGCVFGEVGEEVLDVGCESTGDFFQGGKVGEIDYRLMDADY